AGHRRLVEAGFVETSDLRLSALEDGPAPLALEAEGARLVEYAAAKGIGQVLLGYPVVAVGVGVEIALAVAEALGVPVRVLEGGRNVGGLRLDRGQRVEIAEGGVGLGRSGEVEGRVSEMVLPLGHAHAVEGPGAGQHDL